MPNNLNFYSHFQTLFYGSVYRISHHASVFRDLFKSLKNMYQQKDSRRSTIPSKTWSSRPSNLRGHLVAYLLLQTYKKLFYTGFEPRNTILYWRLVFSTVTFCKWSLFYLPSFSWPEGPSCSNASVCHPSCTIYCK